MLKRLIKYFLQGLLYITPMAVTLYVIYFLFSWIDGLLRDLSIFEEGAFSEYSFPGIGIVIILAGVTLIGFLGHRIFTAPLVSAIEGLLERTPLIKQVYGSVKDLMSAFVGKDRKFDHPVLVKLDESRTVERLGFVTAMDLSSLGVYDKIAVYLPSSYGMLGELVIVPAINVTRLEANSAEVMKFIVSGGIIKVGEEKK
ncbi:putative membrane protein [Breznakibacter xylanolyticus]|uniref:Putative membrane protein n=1 Tax=Breznakibacter xylanolyticus TaxID=990 RepID=A0A2W7PZL5_9BACT|nr:DUF502 domain-containing protein [Breznakibacter xylanolyticus]MBN2744977.1 DUF502 domain-containing protein [Marinilabiliaceae bacterium]PZX14979.1 putative membrane protein [Breznakibacter xylanolyticus]